jgi:hypothetical protein
MDKSQGLPGHVFNSRDKVEVIDSIRRQMCMITHDEGDAHYTSIKERCKKNETSARETNPKRTVTW